MRQPALDDDSLDRLLSGGISPDDVPPGLSLVAALFRVAVGPASVEEVDRGVEVVTAGISAIRTSTAPSASHKRRSPILTKLLSAKFAAAATVAVVGAGTTAAAATGNLPTQRPHPVHAGPNPTAGQQSTSTTTASGGTGSPGSVTAGSASAGNSAFGLCSAYFASGAGTGPNASAPPFEALIAGHGGAAGSTTYCQAFVAANHPGTSTTSTSSTSTSSTSTTTTPPDSVPAPDHATPSPSPAATTAGPPANAGTPASVGPPASPGRPATAGPPASTGPPAAAGSRATAGNAPVVTPNRGGTNTASTASGGNSASGSSRAGTASGGASTAGSGNASTHR